MIKTENNQSKKEVNKDNQLSSALRKNLLRRKAIKNNKNNDKNK